MPNEPTAVLSAGFFNMAQAQRKAGQGLELLNLSLELNNPASLSEESVFKTTHAFFR